jgi:leader peptidase (prepilin peptidase)/N-methyltransferase
LGVGWPAGAALVLPWLPVWLWPAWSAFIIGGVWLAVIDARTGLLPRRLNWISYAAVAAGVVAAAFGLGWMVLAHAVIGSLLAGGVLWLIWRFTRLGFGDVRLGCLIGLVSGTSGPIQAMLAIGLGATLGVIQGLLRKKQEYPFGPALVAGAILAVPLGAIVG